MDHLCNHQSSQNSSSSSESSHHSGAGIDAGIGMSAGIGIDTEVVAATNGLIKIIGDFNYSWSPFWDSWFSGHDFFSIKFSMMFSNVSDFFPIEASLSLKSLDIFTHVSVDLLGIN